MKIIDYASELTVREGKKESVNIAQVSEVLKLINKDLWGIPYALIKLKKKNKNAGFTGAEILITVAIVGAVFTFIPQLNPIAYLQKFGGPSGAASAAGQKATWTKQTEKQKPVFYTIPPTATQPGTAIVGQETERTYDTGTEEKAQVLTYGQRVAKFFAGLTTWGLVLVIGGSALLFFVFGITPGMVWRRAKIKAEEALEKEKADKEKYKKALTQTVEGIREIKDATIYDAVTSSLGNSQDKDVKTTIDIVKSEMHK